MINTLQKFASLAAHSLIVALCSCAAIQPWPSAKVTPAQAANTACLELNALVFGGDLALTTVKDPAQHAQIVAVTHTFGTALLQLVATGNTDPNAIDAIADIQDPIARAGIAGAVMAIHVWYDASGAATNTALIGTYYLPTLTCLAKSALAVY
jgi:hypothetical protein